MFAFHLLSLAFMKNTDSWYWSSLCIEIGKLPSKLFCRIGRKDILRYHITVSFSARTAHRGVNDGQEVQFHQHSFRNLDILWKILKNKNILTEKRMIGNTAMLSQGLYEH